jgi:diguanylate cyclase (GGDEF)-like protein
MKKNKKLLVFDDDALVGQTIVAMGKTVGVEVKHVSSYDAFSDLLSTWQPSHIILDLMMPNTNGIDVLVDLTERNVKTSIIIISGLNIRILEAAGRSAAARGLNVVGILPKPFNLKQFKILLDAKLNLQSDTLKDDAILPLSELRYVAKRLEKTIDDNALEFFLQPKLDCRNASLTGFEVLSRWTDPVLGFVSPDVFIAAAEKHLLINKLTILICAKSFAWFSDFLKKKNDLLGCSNEHVTLSVNISSSTLTDLKTMACLEKLCEQHNLSPNDIVFELTETAAMKDPILSLDMMTRLRMKGFKLSIDDFGTGFSSMLQLVRLPFSELKIDKSFVLTAQDSRESKIVIKATIELAHSLGLQVIAEGVETENVFNYLKSLNCDQVQGYLFARPLSPSLVLSWVIMNQNPMEHGRLLALNTYELLDKSDEYRFDRITRLAARVFKAPMVFVSLITNDRQLLKFKVGLSIDETPRAIAFCDHTIQQEKVMIVPNAILDQRFADNPLVIGEPFIRFYAGYPICSPEGDILGAFCVMDIQPRHFTEQDITMLADLAAMVEEEIFISNQLTNDYLTGLLNRNAFEQRGERMLQFCSQEQYNAILVYIDLDDFKVINDVYGHHTGDEALKYFSTCLRKAFRESDLIARMGGDEFVVFLIDTTTEQTISILNRLSEIIRSNCLSNLHVVDTIGFSAGVAVSSVKAPVPLDQLYQQADLDMYEHKRLKKNESDALF